MMDISQAELLEAQLVDLYAGAEKLTNELGSSDPHAIIEMVKSLRAQLAELTVHHQVASLEAQLCDMYSRREFLAKEIGVSDPDEIINLVRSMEQQLVAFYQTKDATRSAA